MFKEGIQKKKILFLVPWLEIGGADQFNLNLIKGLRNYSWSVVVVTTEMSTHPAKENFLSCCETIIHLEQNSTDSTSHLLEAINTTQPAVIFLSHSMLGYNLLPFIKLNTNIPIIDYVHCEEVDWLQGGYANMSAKYSGFIDKTLVTSFHLKEYCISKGHNPSSIEVLYINVDTNKFKPNRDFREHIRNSFSIAPQLPVILFVGRLTEQKQPEILIKTLKRLTKNKKEFHCFIIGNGPEFGKIKKLINRLGIKKSISMLGALPNSEVEKYMDASDLFFLPSKFEGISLAIFEAMSKALCIVGANVGGQKELVTKNTGYLIEPQNSNDQIEKYSLIIGSLIDNLNTVKEKGINARKRVVENFDLHNMISKIDQILSLTTPSKVTNLAFLNAYNFQLFKYSVLQKDHDQKASILQSRLGRLLLWLKNMYKKNGLG